MLSINISVLCDKSTSYIGMTTRLFVRIENHLFNNLSLSNSATKSHRDQCKTCRETMPTEQDFTLLKKSPFNTETELIGGAANQAPQTIIKDKTRHSQGAKSSLRVFHREVQC